MFFIRSKTFQILVRVDVIHLIRKSSKFEPSSQFFGCLKIFNVIFGLENSIWTYCYAKKTAIAIAMTIAIAIAAAAAVVVAMAMATAIFLACM